MDLAPPAESLREVQKEADQRFNYADFFLGGEMVPQLASIINIGLRAPHEEHHFIGHAYLSKAHWASPVLEGHIFPSQSPVRVLVTHVQIL
jgi:hypothetical protein